MGLPWAPKWQLLSPISIFMAKVETEILNQSALKPLVWKRFIDDIFSLWTATREENTQFIEQANKHHQTVKFTAEVSETETNFMDTTDYKGERFRNESVLDVRTILSPLRHFSTPIFQPAIRQE